MTSRSTSSGESSDQSSTGSNLAARRFTDPFVVLGIDARADEATVRARYLELVREYPPDRDPAMFSEIRHAYEAASNPIVMAQRLIESVRAEPRPWKELLDEHVSRPPRLPTELLMSLGNRKQLPKATGADETDASATETES